MKKTHDSRSRRIRHLLYRNLVGTTLVSSLALFGDGVQLVDFLTEAHARGRIIATEFAVRMAKAGGPVAAPSALDIWTTGIAAMRVETTRHREVLLDSARSADVLRLQLRLQAERKPLPILTQGAK